MIPPFKFWCQKVLPAVYDDSLSYYELLCKVVAKLNEVINSFNSLNEVIVNKINEIQKEITDFENSVNGNISAIQNQVNILKSQFTQLKNYVDNYFKNLDVQDEINKKLDEMAESGQLDDLAAVILTKKPAKLETIFNDDLHKSVNAFHFENVVKALNSNRPIKIAAIGDSITAGANIYKPDSWFYFLMNYLDLRGFPLTYQNFAIGGTKTSDFINDTIDVSGQPWYVPGKTWKQTVIDYAPDLIFIAWGVNEPSGFYTNNQYLGNIITILNYFKNDRVVVTPELTALDKSVLPIPDDRMWAFSAALRDLPLNNVRVNVMDVNSIWTVLSRGISKLSNQTMRYVGVNSVQGKTCLNCELNFSINQWNEINQSADIYFRQYLNTNAKLAIRFYSDGIYNYCVIQAIVNDVYSPVEIAKWQITTNTINLNIKNTHFTLNGVTKVVNGYLYTGPINFNSAFKTNLGNITAYIEHNLSVDYFFDDEQMLGPKSNYNTPNFGGNGQNHPSPFGMYSTYNLCASLIADKLITINNNLGNNLPNLISEINAHENNILITRSFANSLKNINNNNTLKCAIIGDEIGYGSFQTSELNFFNQFVSWFSNRNFNIQSKNFCVPYSSAKTYHSNTQDISKMPWYIAGKTWKEIVLDYAPDLLIIQFGLHDDSGSAGAGAYANYIVAISDYHTKCDKLVITPSLGPTDQSLQPDASLNAKAIVLRGLTKVRVLNVLDVNLIWDIYARGYAPSSFENPVSFNLGSISKIRAYNFNITFDVNTWPSKNANALLSFRQYLSSQSMMCIKIYTENNLNYCDIGGYYNNEQVTVTHHIQITGNKINLKAINNYYYVNGTSYLYNGYAFYGGMLANNTFSQSISNFTGIAYEHKQIKTFYSDETMLGNSNIPFNGNGSSVPTPFALTLTYVKAMRIFYLYLNSISKQNVATDPIPPTPPLIRSYTLPIVAEEDNFLYTQNITVEPGYTFIGSKILSAKSSQFKATDDDLKQIFKLAGSDTTYANGYMLMINTQNSTTFLNNLKISKNIEITIQFQPK